MRLIAVITAALFLSASASAQSDTGTIHGIMRNAHGPLVGVEVRVRHATTQEVSVAKTTDSGEYSVAVPPGVYDVFASAAAHTTFARRDLEVRAGAQLRVDGVLNESQNAGTPGELFFIYAASERKPPTGPAPTTHDGRPDLSGVWFPGNDLEPENPPFQPWAAALAKERAARAGDDPRARCLPSGIVRTNALDLAKFVQTPNVLIMLIEGSVPGASGVSRWTRPPQRAEPDLARPLDRQVGTRHARCRFYRLRRQRMARQRRPAADRAAARDRALPPPRPRSPRGRDHDR